MQYKKYFKPGQRVILKTLPGASSSEVGETFTTFLVRCEQGLFELSLPIQQHPQKLLLDADTSFEVLSEAFGLGLRFVGQFFEYADHNILRLRADGNLTLFYRRHHLRADTQVGLLYTRSRGGLRETRAQWSKSIKILERPDEGSRLPPFNRCRVNLSAGGIRFPVKTPVEVADLFLVFLNIKDNEPPICILSEVVWVDNSEMDGARTAGIRFVDILDSDQKRIDRFVQNISQ